MAADRLQVVLAVVKQKNLLRFRVVRHRTGVIGASFSESRPGPEATSSSYEQVIVVSRWSGRGHFLVADGAFNRNVTLHADERRGYWNKAAFEQKSISLSSLSITLASQPANQIIY
jgi:hypothetical protein